MEKNTFLSKLLKYIIILCLFVNVNNSFCQTILDTVYYDNDWNVCKKYQSMYYRVIHNNKDSLGYRFTDFYLDGKIQGTGHFISLGETSDNTTKFNGKTLIYRKDGSIQTEMNYKNGLFDGKYVEYDIYDNIIKDCFFINGVLDGPIKYTLRDGTLFTAKVTNGIPDSLTYSIINRSNYPVNIAFNGNCVYFQSPERSGRKMIYRNNKPWQYYVANGVTYAISLTSVKQYGKWYMVEISITNDSPNAIDFDASNISASFISRKSYTNEFDTTILNAWTVEEYYRKVKRRQDWTAAMYGISAGLSAGSAGYTQYNSSTISYNPNQGTTYSYSSGTIYNSAASNYALQEAEKNISSFESAQWEARNKIFEGYLGKNTILPGEILNGYVLIKRKKTDYMVVRLDVEGIGLLYDWNVSK